MTKILLCKDCEHLHEVGNDFICKKQIKNPINGELSQGNCLWMRLSPYFCGMDGKWFEERDEK